MKYQKLAFFIENPHHLDFYKNIFSYLNKAQFYIILNDKDKNREIFKEPISLIEKFNLNYFFLSEAEDFYFDYIVSTLESKILYFNLLKKKFFFLKVIYLL